MLPERVLVLVEAAVFRHSMRQRMTYGHHDCAASDAASGSRRWRARRSVAGLMRDADTHCIPDGSGFLRGAISVSHVADDAGKPAQQHHDTLKFITSPGETAKPHRVERANGERFGHLAEALRAGLEAPVHGQCVENRMEC